MTMDDPGWGGYVPPSESQAPPPPPPAHAPSPAPAPERLAQSAATVGQQQVAKAGAWLAIPKNKKIAIGAAVVVVILIIGATLGLGGGGSGGLSKAQYIAKADAICTSFSPQLTTAESAGNVSQVVSLAQSELAQLQALGLPSQDPQAVTAWLNDEQAAVTALQQSNQTQFTSNVTKGAAAASAYGLQACAG